MEQWPHACVDHLRFNADGLIPAITQDWLDGAVLMLAWMNRQALLTTFETGQVHYWSRSRQALWHKGATSGHIQLLRGFRYDCDGDALLLTVEQVGAGACHTGARSCFFEASAKPSTGGPQALLPPVDALSARARAPQPDCPGSNAVDPAASLEAACQALLKDWRQGMAGADLTHSLALVDALQAGLAAHGVSWRQLLKRAAQGPAA
ncbi:phosphoribosyl-AMP cyclohydrolase [Synechococcus sp. ATX 2A4]|uniref:phosphoribosyl-AMP cyclohydrolase n=1 Tax=Synechococcus sp. ATX 2A4 TaxID=2823727 RepID=UPI0020CE8A01|nr:phosphoribosyl-AMP cyclohydrolase [Synechococcus sp. ATX 2A4]MCP9885078.1 phosphoribosyl-AMP cyclohydrolase [Synechococcus sp. ATX 2A4]